MTQPMRTCVQEAVGNAPQTSDAYKYLVTFSDMADETFGGIETEVRNHLALFSTDEDIRYFLKDNALRCSPERINDGCMVYLRLREEKLTAYNDLLQVILNQTFAVLEKRSEYAEPCVVFIDELPRLVSSGKLERLLDGMRTLRSRKVTLCLVTQSLEALEGAYTPAQIADMQSNCSYRAILSANSAKTQREITAACGKYQEVKQTTSGEGSGEKTTRTYEERDIVQPVDLVRLPTSGELVLLSTYGYCRIKKTPYYKEPIFSGTAARNVESHRARKREDA
jgi:type IV secretory pathway TraG/TraD family ATPase VirD4